MGMSPIYAELHRWRAQPFAWGWHDCIMAPFGWVERVRGVNPGAHLIGSYSSAGEVERLTRFFTDPMGCIGPMVEAVGMALTDAPRAGDIGLTLQREAGRLLPCGMMCLDGDLWAALGPNGDDGLAGVLIARPHVIIGAWGVGYAE